MRHKWPLLTATFAVMLTTVVAEAASVKSVQSGIVDMGLGTPQTVPITTVVLEKSFVVCATTMAAGTEDRLARCELAASTLTITSTSSNAGSSVRWHVVEFEGGVSVQRGLATYGTAGTLNIALAPVDLSKSFVIISVSSTSTDEGRDERWLTRARLTSSTDLELVRNEAADDASVAWQVVTMEGASVQRGLTTLGNGLSSTTASIAAVNPAASFLLTTLQADASIDGQEGRYRIRGELTDATTLTFTREGSQSDIFLAWEVVSLSDGTSVQRGTATTAATSDATMDVTFAAVDTARSVPFRTVSGGSDGDNTNLGSTSWAAALTSSTGLRLTRGNTGILASVAWAVVQFYKCPAVPDPGYIAATGRSGLVKLSWESATPVLILRKTSAFTTEAPSNGRAYAVNDTIGAATVVYSGSAVETSFTQTGLTNGTTYHFKVVPKGAGAPACYAAGTIVRATPAAGNSFGAWTWSYTMAGGSMLKAGIAGSGTIYTSSNASRIVSLGTANGEQSWVPVATSGPVQGALTWIPLSGGGSAVIGGDQTGRLYLVNPTTGTATWSLPQTGADAIQAATAAQLHSYSNAAFKAVYTTDVLFAATRNASTTNNRLFAIRASDGAVLWTFNQTGAQNVDYIAGMPYVDYARNRIYVASRAGATGTQNSLWVLDSLNGALLAAFNVGHVEMSPTLRYDGTILYVANTAGDLYALNTTTLAMRWSSPFALGAAVKSYVWEDWVSAGLLYFSTADGFVWAIRDQGNTVKVLWKTAVAGPSAPLVTDDAIFVGSSDGKIHQLQPGMGQDMRQATVGDGASTVGDLSTETGGVIFAGTTAGTLYKIPLPLPTPGGGQ